MVYKGEDNNHHLLEEVCPY